MKKIILLSFAFLACNIIEAQNKTKPKQPTNFFESTKEEEVAYVTSKKDTLYLVNDPLGKAIACSWEGEYYQPERDGKRPHIVFVDVAYLRNRHEYMVKANPKKKLLTQQDSKMKK